MANWINFNVVGGFDVGTGADPTLDGDNLLLAESIIGVAVAETASRMTATLTLTGGLVCTAVCSTDNAATDPDTATPGYVDYEVMLKGAITRAMTANPGGAKATVNCPLDQDPMVGYNPANKVYWKDLQVA